MLHCWLCAKDFPDETPMVAARGSVLCRSCADTPRGREARRDPEEMWRSRYRVGEDFDHKTRLHKAIHYWQTGRRMTAAQVRKLRGGNM